MALTHTENPLKDGEAIRIARSVLKWSQRRLSEKSGIPPWRIWKIENGLITPADYEVTRLWAAMSSGERHA